VILSGLSGAFPEKVKVRQTLNTIQGIMGDLEYDWAGWSYASLPSLARHGVGAAVPTGIIGSQNISSAFVVANM
jgi:hypothetical protein